jgi:hypothetical protein
MLHLLDTVYSIEDVFDMHEALDWHDALEAAANERPEGK